MAARKKPSKPTLEQKQLAEAAISSVTKQVKFNIAEYPVSMYVSRFPTDTGGRYFVPEYQRNLSWNDEQKSLFLESLIVGLPIPFMFFYQTSDGRMEIVDGSQRMRAMRAFINEGLRLQNLVLLPELVGFSFEDLPKERRNKLEDVTIRTIILDTDTEASTRAEMFARINRMGTLANEAEIRRGSLPGPVTDLIQKIAESDKFAAMTPLTKKAIDAREREELVTRFFAYYYKYDTPEGKFPGYRDRPKKFLYDYLKEVNIEARKNPQLVNEMHELFFKMLDFVKATFSFGFRKAQKGNTIPRVRFESISVGSALAIKQNPTISKKPELVDKLMVEHDFNKIVVSDGANVRSKLEKRIEVVKAILEEK